MPRFERVLPGLNAAPALLLSCALALLGCSTHGGQAGTRGFPELDSSAWQASRLVIAGVVDFALPRGVVSASRFRTQADLAEVANAATVSLIDAQTGDTVSSSVTDASGAFVLTFQQFSPVSGAPYTLEAVKGLAVGGKPNRPGAPAVRIRTLLFWDGGWRSLTSTTPGVGIAVSVATTAVSTLASLKKSAGQAVDLSTLVGKVSGAAFDETSTGLSRDADYAPVLSLVGQALALDQDPVGGIAYDKDRGAYRLATGVPLATGIEPAIPTPGQTVTIRGLSFDPNPGRNVFWFGDYPAATWSVSADRSAATVAVPAAAFSSPLTLQQPGGVLLTLQPFLQLRGTAGTLAGSGNPGYRDGTGQGASFSAPYGIVSDSLGNLIVVDRSNCRIRKITPGGAVTTLAGGDCGFAEGTGGSARFRSPLCLAIDGGDNLYVSDYGNHRICRVSPDGVVTTLAGDGSAGYAEGTGTTARFNGPEGIAADAGGNVYVADYLNRRIRKITPDGATSTYAGTGSAGCGDGATATSATFSDVMGLALDSAGNLWAADWACGSVRRIAAGGGAVTTPARGLERPEGIVAEPGGSALVTEYYTGLIRRVTAGGAVSTLAGSLVDYVDGPLASAAFVTPNYITRDAGGTLYVTEGSGHRIRVITP